MDRRPREPRGPGEPRDPRDERLAGEPRDERDERRAGDPRDKRDPISVTFMIAIVSVLSLFASCVIAYVLLTLRANDLANVQAQFHIDQHRIMIVEDQLRQEAADRQTELERRRMAFCVYLDHRPADPQVAAAARDLWNALDCGPKR